MTKKGCLYISLAFITLIGGCTISLLNDIQKNAKECLLPIDLNEPHSLLMRRYNIEISKEFESLDSYDSGRTCSFLPDGETNAVFKFSEKNLNIQEIVPIDGLQWMQGPIDKKLKGFHLYRFAFGSWDRHFKDHRRPKLSSNIPFFSRKKLFESRSFYHLGSCQHSKEDEFIPCGDGFLMIYDPEIKLLYVSQFNS